MSETSKLNTRRVGLFALALLVQVAVIGGLAYSASRVAQTGATAYLKIEPVDPRDPLRGDYMTFQYTDVSQISAFEFESDSTVTRPKTGDIVYVPLRREGKYWQYSWGPIRRTLPERSDREPGVLYLRGTVKYAGSGGDGGTDVEIAYGIEEYFIEEGTGVSMPATSNDWVARIAVTDDGISALRQLYVDGKEWP